MFTAVRRSEVVVVGGGVFTISGARLQIPFIHPSLVPIALSDCAIWSEAKAQTCRRPRLSAAVDELRPAPNAAKDGKGCY